VTDLTVEEHIYGNDGKLNETWNYTMMAGEVQKEFHGIERNNDETAIVFKGGDFDLTTYSYNPQGDIESISRYLLK